MRMRLSLVVRFGYGITVPWAEKPDSKTLVFIAGPDMLVLRSPVDLQGEDTQTTGDFAAGKDKCISFVLSYRLSYLEHPAVLDVDRVFLGVCSLASDGASTDSWRVRTGTTFP